MKGVLALHLLLVVSISLIVCDNENITDLKRQPNQTKRFCGAQIGNIIAAVCNGTYAAGRMKRDATENPSLESLFKASNDDAQEGENKSETETEEEDRAVHRFINRVAARRIIFKTQRHKRGVVNECCIKSCSYNELLTYCGDRNDLKKSY